jgi:Ran GTPase-activating protein (RanGAP) involved in mRNA processing and transport
MLANGLNDNVTLTELFMTHNDLSGPSGEAFIKSLQGKPALKSLALNNCHVSLRLVEQLAEVLQHNETLKELYLYSNKLGPDDAMHIAKMLTNKRKLTALGLSNNFIG